MVIQIHKGSWLSKYIKNVVILYQKRGINNKSKKVELSSYSCDKKMVRRMGGWLGRLVAKEMLCIYNILLEKKN